MSQTACSVLCFAHVSFVQTRNFWKTKTAISYRFVSVLFHDFYLFFWHVPPHMIYVSAAWLKEWQKIFWKKTESKLKNVHVSANAFDKKCMSSCRWVVLPNKDVKKWCGFCHLFLRKASTTRHSGASTFQHKALVLRRPATCNTNPALLSSLLKRPVGCRVHPLKVYSLPRKGILQPAAQNSEHIKNISNQRIFFFARLTLPGGHWYGTKHTCRPRQLTENCM